MEIALFIVSAVCSLAAVVVAALVTPLTSERKSSGVLHIIGDEDGDYIFLELENGPWELGVGEDVVFTVVRDNYNDFNGTDIHRKDDENGRKSKTVERGYREAASRNFRNGGSFR